MSFRFKEGDKLNYLLEQKTKSTMSLAGTDIIMKVDATLNLSWQVVKIDDKGKRMELGIRNGDVVWYGKYSGTEVDVDGEKFVILRESDLLGVVEK